MCCKMLFIKAQYIIFIAHSVIGNVQVSKCNQIRCMLGGRYGAGIPRLEICIFSNSRTGFLSVAHIPGDAKRSAERESRRRWRWSGRRHAGSEHADSITAASSAYAGAGGGRASTCPLSSRIRAVAGRRSAARATTCRREIRTT